MKTKNFSLVLATTFLLVILSTTVMALSPGGSIAIVVPSSNAILADNVTIRVNVTSQNIVNCSIWVKSVSTANLTYTQMRNATGQNLWISNSTTDDNLTVYNITIDTFKVEDSNDYTLKAICSNSTLLNVDNLTSSEITGIVVDNTNPATPTSLDPATDTVDTDGTVNFSCSVTDTRTTGCTIYFSQGNPGASTYAMAYAGSSCSKELSNIPEQTYAWYCQASDGSNTTDSSANRATIDQKSSANKIPALLQQKGVTSAGGATLSVAGTGNGISFSWLRTPIPVLGELWFGLVIGALVVVIIWAVKLKK